MMNPMAMLNCGKGHQLAWSTNCAGHMAGIYSCEFCKTGGLKCGVGRWACDGCTYDICHTCRPPIDDKCSKGLHVLTTSFDGTGYLGGKYACDKCHSSYPCVGGRYTCPCKYDLCPVCKSK